MVRIALVASLCLLLGGLASPVAGWVRVGSTLSAAPAASEACAGCTALFQSDGVRLQHIPFDGVVTRWFARTASASQPVTFVVARESGGGFVRVASASGTSAGTSLLEAATRIVVRRGDRIGVNAIAGAIQSRALTGASYVRLPTLGDAPASGAGVADRELPVAALVESDADGDGFGDETQDECPDHSDRQAAPCSGHLVGTPLLGAFPTEFIAPDSTTVQLGAPVPAPGGVVVRWRLRASRGTFGVQVLRPEGAGLRNVGEAVRSVPVAEVAYTADAPMHTVPARLPVRAGDRLGLRTLTGAPRVNLAGGPGAQNFTPAPAAGELAPSPTSLPNWQVAFGADVEPDADGDGFGDQTQDRCPAEPGTSGACAAPATAPAPPAPISVPVLVTQVRSPVLRPGTAALAAKRLRYRGTTTLGVPLRCPAGVESCKGVLQLKVGKRSAGKQAYALKAGQRKTVNVKLSARAKRALRKGGKVSARIVPEGPKPANGTLTLTR